jgi:hypothetical protein
MRPGPETAPENGGANAPDAGARREDLLKFGIVENEAETRWRRIAAI